MSPGSRSQQSASSPLPAPGSGSRAVTTLGSGYGEGWLRRLVANCWRHKRLSLVAFGASLLATLVAAAIPLIQRFIIDNPILSRTQPIWPGATLLIVAAPISFGAPHLRRVRVRQPSLEVHPPLPTVLSRPLPRRHVAQPD